MSEPIISVSGLRGIIGESLTPEIAARYVLAFAAGLPEGEILVGRDSRPSGSMLGAAVHAALRSLGWKTIDLGIVPTPTVGVLVKSYSAVGAVQITASHNPPQYNGLKLFSAEGRVIPARLSQEVLERYRRDAARSDAACSLSGLDSQRAGLHAETTNYHKVFTPHLQAILSIVDAPLIRRSRFRVLLDGNHGAGGPFGRLLLEELGCRITMLGEEPHGRFAHPPEPLAENLAEVCRAVAENDMDIGFCQDPDADRLAVIDGRGRYLGEEYTLALCAAHILAKRQGPIVANCATSRMSEDIARRHGVPFVRAPVGEANVVDAMLVCRAVFGGEGNGGPIDPHVVLVRDSFVGMALLLDYMATRRLPIDRLADELPKYDIVKRKRTFPQEKLSAAYDALEKRFPKARAERMDGLRLDWPNRWLLLRGSNTEPVVRIIAEAPLAAEAEKLCQAVEETLQAL